ncbi:hypothetical protein CBR_g40350 [Chara braunii]|uniref:CCHC-type domain-containing protein n=1 Tax=Chara braunii TaxID=69332 RepID=A0A388LTT3_CHABU|nr:hypothetical protein CBR_g40350 [Chara braunii]|eukprot:GBG85622.1 hypothetical protein CBR_g40350 [Chara braunii]
MANRGYWDTGRDVERERRDTRHEGRREDSREGYRSAGREYYQEDVREAVWDRGYMSGERRRRAPPTCFECGQVGHYHNQCPKLTGEGSSRQGEARLQPRLGTEEESPERAKLKRQIEDLGASITSMQGHIKAENRKKAKKEKRRLEKAERLKKDEEEQRAKEKKEAKKQAKLKEAEDFRMQMRKEVRMEAARVAGELRDVVSEDWRDQIKEELRRIVTAILPSEKEKGKAKQQSPPSTGKSGSGSSSSASDVESLRRRTRRLAITEKRKRSMEKTLGSSSPVMQPAKRTPRTAQVKPVKLAAKLQTAKKADKMKTPPPRCTPRRRTPRTKIAATLGTPGKENFICENIRVLAEYGADELKDICRKEEVEYGNKTVAAMNIAEKRAAEAYDNPNQGVVEGDAEVEEID